MKVEISAKLTIILIIPTISAKLKDLRKVNNRPEITLVH
jgi:hypothetical protein